MYRYIVVSLIMGFTLAGCDQGAKTPTVTSDGFQVRTGDLPTIKEAAAIYPELAGAQHLVTNIDAVTKPVSRLRCDQTWSHALAVTSGREVSFVPGTPATHDGVGESVSISMASFADALTASRALHAIKQQIRTCAGSRKGSDGEHGQQEHEKTLKLSAGFIGSETTTRYAKKRPSLDWPADRTVRILGQRQGFVVSVDVTGPIDERIDKAEALRLAKLARSIAGRAPDAHEPIPAGATLHDYLRKPRLVRDMTEAGQHREWPEAFQTFVGTMADGDLPEALPGCDPIVEIYKYRSDGYAHLGVTNCFVPAAQGYYAARSGKAWKVIVEGDAPGPGLPISAADCQALAAATFPSQIAGTWCTSGPGGSGREYPLR